MAMLAALIGWRGYAVAAGAGALIAAAGTWTAQAWRYDAQIAVMQRDAAQQLADAQQLARQVEQARWMARDEVVNDAKDQMEHLQAVTDDALDELDRVRAELARVRASHPAAAGRSASEPGTDTIGLLAQLYEQGARDALERSRYADGLRIAGLACERLYDSLR